MLARSVMYSQMVNSHMLDKRTQNAVRLGLLVCLLTIGSLIAACSSSPPATVVPPTSTSGAKPPGPTSTTDVALSPLQEPTHDLGQSPLATPGSPPAIPPLETPDEVPIPEAGKAAISGVLYTFSGQGPIPGTLFYLTPGRGDNNQDPPAVLVGPQEDKGDISGTSDSKGWIALNDIPPGNYFLVVWAPYNWILASESEVDDTPRLITLEPDQQLNLGVIYVSWP